MAQGIMCLPYTHKYLSLDPQCSSRGQTLQHMPINSVPREAASTLDWLQSDAKSKLSRFSLVRNRARSPPLVSILMCMDECTLSQKCTYTHTQSKEEKRK